MNKNNTKKNLEKLSKALKANISRRKNTGEKKKGEGKTN